MADEFAQESQALPVKVPDSTPSPKYPLVTLAEIEVVLLQNPLNELARKARRNILVFSAIAILMTLAGLVPVEIAALGIKFTGLHQKWMLIFLFTALLWSALEFHMHASYGLVMRDLNHVKLFLELQSLKKLWTERGLTPLGPNAIVGVEQGLLDGTLRTRAMSNFGFRAFLEVYGSYFFAVIALICLVLKLFAVI